MNAQLSDFDLFASVVELFALAETVDAYSAQFNPADISEEAMEKFVKISKALFLGSMLSFGVKPNEGYEDLFASGVKALFMVGKRSGTLTFAVSDGE